MTIQILSHINDNNKPAVHNQIKAEKLVNKISYTKMFNLFEM